jgi:hypothetical protein
MGNKSNEIINRKVSGGMANTKLASRKRAESSHSSLLCESGKREQEVLKGARLPSELRVPQLFEPLLPPFCKSPGFSAHFPSTSMIASVKVQ